MRNFMKIFPVVMLMLFCVQPVCDLSAQMVEDGTADHPFLIQNLEELKAFRDCINGCTDSVFYFANGTYMMDTAGTGYTDVKNIRRGGWKACFKLTTNITLNTGNVAGCNSAGDASWEQWVPIGTATGSTRQSFLGDFDGGGHYVSGLYINSDDANALGLFGCIADGAHVHHVALVNSFIRTVRGHYVGGIVGWNIGCRVDHCFNTSTILGHHGIGGIVGYNAKVTSGESSLVSECYNTGTVKSEGMLTLTSSSSSDAGRQDAGGIVGVNEATSEVRNCYNAGVVRVESSSSNPVNFGGVVGDNSGLVTNCYTDENMCGLGGTGSSGNVNIADTVNGLRTYEMTNGSWGQIGNNTEWTFLYGYYPQIKEFTQTDARNVSKFSVTPVFTYNRDNVEELEYDVTLGGSTEDLVWTSNYPARAVVNAYTLHVVGKGEFILNANAGDTLYRALYMESVTGADEGSITNPFTIDNKEELISLRDDINNGFEFIYKKRNIPAHGKGVYFLLTADINLNGEDTKNYLSWSRDTVPGLVWTAIGKSADVPFSGHFMGGGHTISGVYGTSLFGVLDTNASITNLGVGVGNSLGDGGYVKDGLVIWLDGEQNTRHGHDTTATVWENLAGPNYDFTAYDYETMKWNKNSFYGTGNAGRWHCGSTQWREIYNMQKQDYFTVEAVTWMNLNKTTPASRTLVGTYRGSSYGSYYSGFSIYRYNNNRYPMNVNNFNNRIATLTSRYGSDYYVNGVPVGYSGSYTWQNISISTEPIVLGNGYNYERGWNDSIYGLRVYSRSLTAAEVQQNAEADRNRFVLGYTYHEGSLVSKNHGVVSDCFSTMDEAPLVYENSGTVSHCYNMGRFAQEGDAVIVGVNLAGGTVEYAYYAGTSDHILKMVGVNHGTVSHFYYDRQMAPRVDDAIAMAYTTAEMTSGTLGLPTDHWQETLGLYPRLVGSAESVVARVLANPVILATGEDVRAVNGSVSFHDGVDAMLWKVKAGDGLQLAGGTASVVGSGKTTLQATLYGWPYRTATMMVKVGTPDYGVYYIKDLPQLKIFRDAINRGLEFYYNSADQTFSLAFDENHTRVVPANGKNATFVLLDNINMSSESDWAPIGTEKSSFQGDFNGNGKVISKATWTMKRFYNGLFGKAENAVIRNLGMEDCVFNSVYSSDWRNFANFTGFICASFSGRMDSCYTHHCKILSPQTNYYNYTGGEVGTLVGVLQGILSNSYAQEDTLLLYSKNHDHYSYDLGSGIWYSTIYTYYGGLVGSLMGKSSHCYIKDSKIDDTDNNYSYDNYTYIGGLFGQVSSDTIMFCHNDNSAVSCRSYKQGNVGGVAGGSANATVFHHCYNTGNISAYRQVAGICPSQVAGNVFNYCFNAGDIGLNGNDSYNNSYAYTAAGIGVGAANYCFNTGEVLNYNRYSVQGNSSRVAGLVSSGNTNHCYNAGRVSGLNENYAGTVSASTQGSTSYNVGKYVNHFTSTEYKSAFNDAQMSSFAPADQHKATGDMVSSGLEGSLDNTIWKFDHVHNKYPMLRGMEQYDAAVVSVSPIYLREGERADSVQHDFTVDTTMGVTWSVVDGNAVEIHGNSAVVTGTGSVVLGASKNGVLYKKVYLVVGVSKDRPFIVRNYDELCHFRNGINSAVDFYYKDEVDNEGFSPDTTGGYYVRVPALGEGAWFLQNQDITMPNSTNWVPIGNHNSAVFMGVYDGGHKEIRNMKLQVNNNSIWYSGLFGRMGQGSGIKNLGVVNPNISSTWSNSSCYATGSLVAMMDGVGVRFVDSCYVKGANISAYYRVGALCGRSNAPISNCYADSCVLKSISNYGGGLVGYATHPISDCGVTDITISCSSYGGGLVGYSLKPISHCKVTKATFSGSSYSGGLAGYSCDTVSKCQVSNATISCGQNSGGLVGYATQNANLLCDTVMNIRMTSSSSYLGGIVGRVASTLTIDSCLVQGGYIRSNGSHIGGILGYNSSSNTKVLHCRNMGMTVEGNSNVGGICGYNWNSPQTRYCSNFANVIGSNSTGGIVGNVYNSTISDCYNVGEVRTPETNVNSQYVGGIVGYSEYCVIRRCFNTGRIKGSPSGTIGVGGVFGYDYYSTNCPVQYCYNVGEVSTGQNVGGLVGRGYIYNGYNVGRVSNGTTTNAAIAGNTSSSYTKNVYYDYQMCPSTVVESIDKKRKTIEMVGSNLKGSDKLGTEEYWVFQEGLYPQLKYFAESPDSLDRLVSRVSVTPVFLYDNNDTVETVNNVTHTVTFGAGSTDTVQWTRRSGSGLIINHNIGTPTDTIGVVVADAYLHDTMPYKTVRFLMNITEDNALIIKDYPNLKVFRDGVNSGRPFYYHLGNQDFDTTSHAGDDDYMEIPVGGEDVYFRLAENTFNLSDTAWTPIGTLSSPFRGCFNGSHQTIENMNVNFTPVVNYDSLLSRTPTRTVLMNATSTTKTDTLHDYDVVAFYDDGGPDQNYSNTNGSWRYQMFKAEPGKLILISFKNFTSNYSNDRLYLYNGTSTSSPSLASLYNGTYLNVSYTATSGNLFLRWRSYYQNASGWEAIVMQIPDYTSNSNVLTNDYAGFFGFVTGGYIKNLNFTQAKVSGRSYVGTLAGLTAGRVDSISCKQSTITATTNNVGGVIGRAENSVSHCVSEKSLIDREYIQNNPNYWGGICGYQYVGKMNECYTRGGIVKSKNNILTSSYASSNTGGIVGYNETSLINKCGNTAEVYGNENVGGLVGSSSSSGNRVSFSYNTAKISATGRYVGGIMGYQGVVSYSINTGVVYTDYRGDVYVGGIMGYTYYYASIDGNNGTSFYNINTGHVWAPNATSGYVTGGVAYNGYSSYNDYYCFNAGEVAGRGANTYGLSNNPYYSINVGRVQGSSNVYSVMSNNNYNDKQMCPGVWTYTYTNAEKSTEKMLGNQLQNLLGYNSTNSRNNWIFEEGMYPRLRWTDSLEWARKMAIVACTPVHLAKNPSLNHVNEVDTVFALGGKDTVVWKRLKGNGFEKMDDYQYKPSANMGAEYFGAAWHEFQDSIYKVVRLINSSEDKPVIIKNRAELIKFRDYINTGEEFYYDPVDTVFYATCIDSNHVLIPAFGEFIHFRLDAEDADMTGLTWTSIGNSNTRPFKGYFNGNNKVISHLTTTNTSYSGLFGYVVDGSIKNVKITEAVCRTGSSGAVLCGYANRTTILHDTVSYSNITVYGTYSGGICGNANNSKITGCCVMSTTISSSGYERVGGICGHATGTIIDSCHAVNVNISSQAYFVGGVCGYSNSSIRNCSYQSSSLNITGGQYYNIGGICGCFESGNIENCFNTSTINTTNSYRVGGICGYKYSGSITQCYNTAPISNTSGYYVGGISGYNNSGNITLCYNTGSVKGAHVGGISGFMNSGNITRCFNTGNIADNNYSSAFMMGGITSNGTVRDSYNAGRILARKASAAGSIVGNGDVERCYNIGYLQNEGDGTLGMIIGNTASVTLAYNDKQMNPNGMGNPIIRKNTTEMVGTAMKSLLGEDNWVYADGMYPRLKGMDTVANAIAFALPVYLYGAQNVDMVRTQFKVQQYPDRASSWSGPQIAFDLSDVNTVGIDSARVRRCGLDTLTVSYKGQHKVLPMNVDRLEITFIDVHTCGGNFTWDVTGKLYTRSGNYTEAYALTDKCDSVVTLRLFIPTVPLQVMPGFSHISCYGQNDGVLDATLLGGSGYYKMQWMKTSNDSIISRQPHVENVPPGTYTILLQDSLYEDCQVSKTVTINEPAPLEAEILSADGGCFGIKDGYIELNIQGGTPTYEVKLYSATSSDSKSVSNAGRVRIGNLEVGDWTVDVTDINHCQMASLKASFWEDPRRYVVQACSLEKLYDGVPVTVDTFTLTIGTEAPFVPNMDSNHECPIYDSAGYFKDFLHVEVSGVTRKDAGVEFNNVTACMVIRRYDDPSIPNDTITCHYNIATYNGIVNIRRRDLTLTSPTYVQIGYFDEPVSKPTVEFSGDGLALGDTVVCTNFPAVIGYTDTGSVGGFIVNTFDTTWVLAGTSVNYDVHLRYGTLAVVHDTTVIITASSATKMYDCTPLSLHEYTYVIAPVLPENIVMTIVFADTSVITDAGTRMNHIQDYLLYDTLNHRVYSTVYKVICRDGELTVKKRQVVMASDSAEQLYNGLPLIRNALQYSGDGFAPCDTVGPITVTGSITEPGSVPNTISYTTTSSYKPSNYDLTVKEGVLTVYPRPLFVSGDSLEVEYTGATYELTSIRVAGLASGQSATGLTYTTGAHRSTGFYQGKFFGELRVIDTNLVNRTHCYDIQPYDTGFLKINKIQKPILIASQSKNKVYDGRILVHEVYDVTYDGAPLSRLSNGSFRLPTGDTIHIFTTYSGARNTGTYDNSFNYMISYEGKDVSGNYTTDSIRPQYGKLMITPRPLVLTSGSDTVVYTGYPVYKPVVDVGGHDFAVREGDTIEGATFTNFASRIDVGDTLNTFEIVFNKYTDPSNYSIDTILGHIVITPATLHLSADDKTRQFGDSVVDYSYFVVGLLGADDTSAITSKPTMTTTAGIDSLPGVYPIIMDVSTAFAKNYIFTGENGKLTVVPRVISLSTGSDTVVYDALPHSILNSFEPYVLTLNGYDYMANFDSVRSHSLDHVNVGVYPNVFDGDVNKIRIMRGIEDYTSAFTIGEIRMGNLVILPDTLTVQVQSATRMYGIEDPVVTTTITGFNGSDTRENCVSGTMSYISGADISAIPDGGPLPGGQYWILPDVSALTSCFGNYVFRADTGAMDIVINTLPIRLASEPDTFVYDGNAHTHHGYVVTYNGTNIPVIAGTDGLKFRLPAGDTLTFIPDATASLTTVGKTTNSFTYTLQHDTYYTDISTFEDTIVMIPCPVDVTIVGKRDTTIYDGTEHHVDGFDIRCANSLYTIHDVTMSGSAYAARTDSGTTVMNLQATQFSNINDNFLATFTVEDGWQMIRPVPDRVLVTLKRRGGETTYDGYEQRVTGYSYVGADHAAYQENYCKFDGPDGDTIAKGRYVGAYRMALDSTQMVNVSPNFSNVVFKVLDDSLLIKPNPTSITITAGSAVKGYDGTPLICNDYTYTDSVLAPGDTLLVVVEGGISELGDSLNRVVEYKVYRDETRNNTMIRTGLRMLMSPPGYTKDVTDCYTFATSAPGHLRIIPNGNAIVTITGHRAEYEYDGLTYTVHGFDVSVADTLGVYSTADFHFTGDSSISQSARGTYHMNLQASQFVNDNPKYGPVTFLISDGRLIIYDTLVVADIITDSVSCKDYHDGEVEITIAGGKRETSPYYNYVIEGVNTHDTYTGTTDDDIHLNSLAPDTYSIVVTDALLYTVTDTFVIEDRSALTVSATVQPALCPNQGTYMVKMTPVGGNGGNHYTWYNVIADGATVVDVDDTSTVVNQIPGNDCAHEYQVGAMVTDRKGCVAKDTVEFIVKDLTKPEFTVPADVTLCRNSSYEIDASTMVAGQPDPATFTDDCSSASQMTVEFHDSDTTGSDNDRRVIHRVWKVTDLCGGFTEHTQNITIRPAISETNSVFTIPANIDTVIPFGQCNIELPDLGTPSFTTSTAWNVSDIKITNDAPASHVYEGGVVIVTWTATDSCGFTLTRQQTITVTFPPCPDAEDCEHNIYHGVRIGCDCWTERNLESTQYSDCTGIPGAYAYYSMDYPDTIDNVDKFGRLYDWPSVLKGGALNAYGHVQGVCPAGWYLPTREKYEELAAYGSDALKSSMFWLDGGGSNSTGFSSLPGGYYDGTTLRYLNLMGEAYYWSTEMSGGSVVPYAIVVSMNCSETQSCSTRQGLGYSVRCIKEKE